MAVRETKSIAAIGALRFVTNAAREKCDECGIRRNERVRETTVEERQCLVGQKQEQECCTGTLGVKRLPDGR